jgi:anti-anti-sigma factor
VAEFALAHTRRLGLAMEMPGGIVPVPRRTVPALSVAIRRAGSAHRLGLHLRTDSTEVRLGGEIDLAAADALVSLLERLDAVRSPLTIDMSDVTFLDCTGLQPLIESTRHREHLGLDALLIGDRSRQAQFLFDATGLGGDPYLDLAAWDRLSQASLREAAQVRAIRMPQDGASPPASLKPVGAQVVLPETFDESKGF